MRKKPRHHLLILAESFPTSLYADVTGGVEMGDFQVSSHLSEYLDVTVLTMARPGVEPIQQFGAVKVIRVGRPVESDQRESWVARVRFVVSALVTARTLNPDIVHGSNAITIVLASLIGLLTNSPAIAMVPDLYGKDWWRLYPWKTAWMGWLLESLITRLPLTYMTYTQVVAKQLNDLRKSAVVVGGGVAPYTPSRKKQPVLVFAGRMVSYKHPEVVVQAFIQLAPAFPTLRLEMIGEGPQKKNLESLIMRAGLRSRVSFKGMVSRHSQVMEAISKAKILIHPSSREGYGFVVLEAATAGTPFIHTDLPVTRELTQKKGGILVPEGSVYHVIEAVSSLLTDEQLYHNKVLELPSIVANHTWKRACQKRLQVINRLLQFSS